MQHKRATPTDIHRICLRLVRQQQYLEMIGRGEDVEAMLFMRAHLLSCYDRGNREHQEETQRLINMLFDDTLSRPKEKREGEGEGEKDEEVVEKEKDEAEMGQENDGRNDASAEEGGEKPLEENAPVSGETSNESASGGGGGGDSSDGGVAASFAAINFGSNSNHSNNSPTVASGAAATAVVPAGPAAEAAAAVDCPDVQMPSTSADADANANANADDDNISLSAFPPTPFAGIFDFSASYSHFVGLRDGSRVTGVAQESRASFGDLDRRKLFASLMHYLPPEMTQPTASLSNMVLGSVEK